MPRPPRSCDARRTPAAVVERVRVLAADHTDRQIAERLNAEGLTSGQGGAFTANKVQWIRLMPADSQWLSGRAGGVRAGRTRGWPLFGPGRGEGAERGASRRSPPGARPAGLDGVQATPHGPWWVRLTPEIIEQLRKPVQGRSKEAVVELKATEYVCE